MIDKDEKIMIVGGDAANILEQLQVVISEQATTGLACIAIDQKISKLMQKKAKLYKTKEEIDNRYLKILSEFGAAITRHVIDNAEIIPSEVDND